MVFRRHKLQLRGHAHASAAELLQNMGACHAATCCIAWKGALRNLRRVLCDALTLCYHDWQRQGQHHVDCLVLGSSVASAREGAKVWAGFHDCLRYGQDVFIDGIATLKGGIVYPYYWYIFTSMVYKDSQYADGLLLAYTEENKMIDTFDPTTNRSEYAMWTFCNNHDNWRMQSMTGKAEMRMCLAVITFWRWPELHR